MFCTKCGKKIESDSKYCEYCGAENELYVENEGNFFKGEILYENTEQSNFPKESVREVEKQFKIEEILIKGSKSGIWTTYLKFICYLCWLANIILGLIIGYGVAANRPSMILFTALVGGGIGFLVGFAEVAVAMLFITTCENIAIVTDNTAMLLRKLNHKN